MNHGKEFDQQPAGKPVRVRGFKVERVDGTGRLRARAQARARARPRADVADGGDTAAATMTVQFTSQQDRALCAASRWLRAGGAQVFRLFGYAGTGKTTDTIIIVRSAAAPSHLAVLL